MAQNTIQLTEQAVNRFLTRESKGRIAKKVNRTYEGVRIALTKMDWDSDVVREAIAEALENAGKLADKFDKIQKLSCTKGEAHLK